jgi:hypothetical protein
MGERVDRSPDVEQRRVRRRPLQRDRLKPLPVAVSPRGTVVEPDPVAQQQLREPMARAHQIHPDPVTSTDQVPQCLLPGAPAP